MFKAQAFLKVAQEKKINKSKKEKAESLVKKNQKKAVTFVISGSAVAGSASTAAVPIATAATAVDIKQAAEPITTQYKFIRDPSIKDPSFTEHHFKFKISAAHFEETKYFDYIYEKAKESIKQRFLVEAIYVEALNDARIKFDEMRSVLKKIHKIELDIANYENVMTYSICNLYESGHLGFYLYYRYKMAGLQLLQKKINLVLKFQEQGQQSVQTFEEVIGLPRDSHLAKSKKDTLIIALRDAIEEIYTIIELNFEIRKHAESILWLEHDVAKINEMISANVKIKNQIEIDGLLETMYYHNSLIQLRIHEKEQAKEQLKKRIKTTNLPQSKLNIFDNMLRELVAKFSNKTNHSCLIS